VPYDQSAAPSHTAGIGDSTGSEVVLLVDDEEAIRLLARRILEDCGYAVYEAANGREGLSLCETHDGQIDLLVTDVMMPVLDGRKLAERAVKLRPDMKVMFMSGCTPDTVFTADFQQEATFLQKPFTSLSFVQTVRATLDSAIQPAAQS
jgi:CheY-like chemotaxis protein